MQSIILGWPQIRLIFISSVNKAPNICIYAISNGANEDENKSKWLFKYLIIEIAYLISPSIYRCNNMAQMNRVINNVYVPRINWNSLVKIWRPTNKERIT